MVLSGAETEEQSGGDERELLYRLRKTCESGHHRGRADRARGNRSRSGSSRRAWNLARRADAAAEGAQAEARGAHRAYRDRDELGSLANAVRRRLQRQPTARCSHAGEALEAGFHGGRDHLARNAKKEKGISLHALEGAFSNRRATALGRRRTTACSARWFEKGARAGARQAAERRSHELPPPALPARIRRTRRSGPSRSVWATLAAIGLDMESVSGSARSRRPAAEVSACLRDRFRSTEVVHLITRAQGGLHDYQAFLHEAGHALHYAGVDPELPYTFPQLSRDHALTEIYSYIVEAISREPAWHAEHFGLSDAEAQENAEATVFLEALLFRRYTAKLQFELEFWGRFDEDGGTHGRLFRAAHRRDGHPLPRARTISPTWTPASTRPTISAPGSDPPSCGVPRSAKWARTGGACRETGQRLRELFRQGTADERGDRRADRVRPARHRSSAARTGRVTPLLVTFALTPSGHALPPT